MPKFYAPGERKGNRTYVVRGYVAGRQREITTNAGDKRGAKREWEAFAAAARKRSEPGAGSPVTFAEVADIYLKARRLKQSTAEEQVRRMEAVLEKLKSWREQL